MSAIKNFVQKCVMKDNSYQKIEESVSKGKENIEKIRDMHLRVVPLIDQFEKREGLMMFILDNCPLLLSYVNSEEEYVFMNKSYETFFDIKREDCYGKHISEVIGKEVYENTSKKHIQDALGGEVVCFDAVVKHINLNASYIPYKNNVGEVEGIVVIAIFME